MVKKVFSILGYVFMGIVILLIAYAVAMGANGKEISIFGYKMYVIKTNSMEPTIDVDTVILVHEEDITKLDVGEVITFDFDSRIGVPNTHRIVGYRYVDSTGSELSTKEYSSVDEFLSDNTGCSVIGYVTRGDNPDIPEDDKKPVLFSDIKGVYVKNLPVITFLFGILTSFFGFLLVILVPLFILLILQLISMYKLRQKHKLEKEAEEAEKERIALEERIKEEAIKEYLSRQQQE